MKKIKILMLSDHPLSPTGVGTQARWLIDGLIKTGRYTFRCFGGAIKHEKYDVIRAGDDLLIKPVDGFGDPALLAQVLSAEHPDVMLLFTDPRFFTWVFERSDEVRSVCPIAYNHLWDCDPYPEFNEPFYADTDLINCINKPTYEMLKQRFPEKVNFAPHAVPQELFYPETDASRRMIRAKLGIPEKDFVALWVGRNARRKRPNDMLAAWAQFLRMNSIRSGATLIMHTNPSDQEGPNLLATTHMLGIERAVKFSPEIVGFEHMRALYAASDVVINTSMNEGFGVPTLEAMACAKPIIATKTGGLTHQLFDAEHSCATGIGLDPDVRALVGGQSVPYIFEDLVKTERFADALTKIYSDPQLARELGQAGLRYARREFSMTRLIDTWDASLTKLVSSWSHSPTVTVL